MATTYDIDFQGRAPILEAAGVSVFLGSRHAVRNVSMGIPGNRVVALVGPSGCGKSSLLRCFNRMHDLQPETRVEGRLLFRGQDIYAPGIDPAEVRQRVGMVFESPNPFPRSIHENVAFGPRMGGAERDLGPIVEAALKEAALWEEVSDRLSAPALSLTVGQQQRLCIARALAVGPQVLLMDQPTLGLDPVESRRIEELIFSLKEKYSVVLVTHDMLQAARTSDLTAFFHGGELVEYGPTDVVFTNPRERLTEAYVTGRLG